MALDIRELNARLTQQRVQEEADEERRVHRWRVQAAEIAQQIVAHARPAAVLVPEMLGAILLEQAERLSPQRALDDADVRAIAQGMQRIAARCSVSSSDPATKTQAAELAQQIVAQAKAASAQVPEMLAAVLLDSSLGLGPQNALLDADTLAVARGMNLVAQRYVDRAKSRIILPR